MSRKYPGMRFGLLAAAMALSVGGARAGWQDMLKNVLGGANEGKATTEQGTTPASTATVMPDQQAMTRAVLQALQIGVKRAVDTLGRQGGYLNDAEVRIPLPHQLQTAESLMRKLGQDKYADQFIQSMNRAAEQAVPQTVNILITTINGMSISDARDIIQGQPDAATRYFRTHASDQLTQLIRPIVARNMDQVGVTSYYKKFISQAGFLQPFVGKDTLDLDAYVTRKTLDGMFVKLAEEEKKIREQPAARTTDILKQVFGYFNK